MPTRTVNYRHQLVFATALLMALVVGLSTGCGGKKDGKSKNKDGKAKDAAPKDANSKDAGSKDASKKDGASKDGSTKDGKKTTQAGSGKFLRHAVFFKFKDASSKDDVKKVVDAFRQLPWKIETIKDFAWGENNSPENKNDTFTHCFLLSFDSPEGLATYIPHKEHAAFGKTLGPHMDKVFVCDYWGDTGKVEENALKHAVFFKFKDDAKPEDVAKVEQEFAALPSKIQEISSFEWGNNITKERHHHGFTHCFMVTFADEAARDVYLKHPEHETFVKNATPVIEKARVLDFTAAH